MSDDSNKFKSKQQLTFREWANSFFQKVQAQFAEGDKPTGIGVKVDDLATHFAIWFPADRIRRDECTTIAILANTKMPKPKAFAESIKKLNPIL